MIGSLSVLRDTEWQGISTTPSIVLQIFQQEICIHSSEILVEILTCEICLLVPLFPSPGAEVTLRNNFAQLSVPRPQ
jgi:hypothetical protein